MATFSDIVRGGAEALRSAGLTGEKIQAYAQRCLKTTVPTSLEAAARLLDEGGWTPDSALADLTVGGQQHVASQRTPLPRPALEADGSVTPARVVRAALFADAETGDTADTQARGRNSPACTSTRVIQPTLQARNIVIPGLEDGHREKQCEPFNIFLG